MLSGLGGVQTEKILQQNTGRDRTGWLWEWRYVIRIDMLAKGKSGEERCCRESTSQAGHRCSSVLGARGCEITSQSWLGVMLL